MSVNTQETGTTEKSLNKHTNPYEIYDWDGNYVILAEGLTREIAEECRHMIQCNFSRVWILVFTHNFGDDFSLRACNAEEGRLPVAEIDKILEEVWKITG